MWYVQCTYTTYSITRTNIFLIPNVSEQISVRHLGQYNPGYGPLVGLHAYPYKMYEVLLLKLVHA